MEIFVVLLVLLMLGLFVSMSVSVPAESLLDDDQQPETADLH